MRKKRGRKKKEEEEERGTRAREWQKCPRGISSTLTIIGTSHHKDVTPHSVVYATGKILPRDPEENTGPERIQWRHYKGIYPNKINIIIKSLLYSTILSESNAEKLFLQTIFITYCYKIVSANSFYNLLLHSVRQGVKKLGPKTWILEIPPLPTVPCIVSCGLFQGTVEASGSVFP